MANETRLKLYKALGNAGFNIGSYEDFDRRMNNAADREKFHYAVSQAGYNIGDFETFDKRIKDSKYQLTTNGKRVNVSEKEYKDFARRHPGKSPQTQQAKQIGSDVFGSPGNTRNKTGVPSSFGQMPTAGETWQDRMRDNEIASLENQSSGNPDNPHVQAAKQRAEELRLERDAKRGAKMKNVYGGLDSQAMISDTDKAVKGDQEAAARIGLPESMRQLQDEKDYASLTDGEMLQNEENIVPFTVNTLGRDENGNPMVNDEGEVITGFTSEEPRVAASDYYVKSAKEEHDKNELRKQTAEKVDEALKALNAGGGHSILEDIGAEEVNYGKSVGTGPTDTEGHSLSGDNFAGLDAYMERAKTRAQYNDLLAAKHLVSEAQGLMSEINKQKNSSEFENFLRNIPKGAADQSVVKGVIDFDDNRRLIAAIQQFEKDKSKLTEEQKLLLDAAAVNTMVQSEYLPQMSTWSKAGQTTGGSASLMLEIAAAPLSGLGKQFAKQMGKKIFRASANRAAARLAAAGAYTGTTALRAPLLTGTIGAPRVAADALRRMQGDIQYGYDENGEFHYAGATNQTEAIKAFRDAFVAGSIENFTEMENSMLLGGFKLASQTMPFISKVTDGLRATKLGKIYSAAGRTELGRMVRSVKERTGLHDFLGENLEEIEGGIMNALFVGDNTIQDVFKTDNLVDIGLGVAPMQMFFSAISLGGYTGVARRAKRNIKVTDANGAQQFGQEEWDKVKAAIDGSKDVNELKNVLTNVISGGQYSNEAARAAYDYARAREGYKGAVLGEAAAKNLDMEEKLATRPANIDVAADGQTVVQKNQNGEVISEEKFDDEEEAKAHADILKMQRAEQDFQDDLATAIEASEQRRQAVENGTPDDFPLSEDMERYVRTQALNRIIPDSVEIGSPEYEAFVRNMDTPGTAENDILLEMMDSFDPLEDAYESVSIDNDSDRNEIDKAIKTDPVKRTERQQKLVSEFAAHLHMFNFPKGELHPEQSFADGQTQAELDGAGTMEADPEAMLQMKQSMDDAQQALDDAVAQNTDLAAYVNETINSNEPFAPEDVISGMIGRFSDEEIATVADYINAQSKLDGYLEYTNGKIQQYVERETSKRAFKGKLNGAPSGNMVMVTDGENQYFLVNGDVQVGENGEILSAGEANGIVVVDEEGNIMPMGLDSSLRVEMGATLEEYAASLLQQQQENTTAQMGFEAPQEEETAEETEGEPAAETQPTQPAPAEDTGTTQGSALDRIPKDEEGNPIYEQGSAEDTYDVFTEMAGSEEGAAALAQSELNEANKRLTKLQKEREGQLKGNFKGKTIQDKANEVKETVNAIETEKGRIKFWNSVLTVPHNRRLESEKNPPAGTTTPPQVPVTNTPPTGEVPEWRYDTPEAARKRGYKIIEGHRIDRQEEKEMPKGMEVEVQYSTKDKVKGRMTVSELGDVQGSHLTNGQRNEKHFLTEAQPKAEFGADRQAAAQTNASEANFRPELMLTFNGVQSAYSGSASQTNRRGEVIQGNGRRNLAEYIYAPGNEAVARKYKDFLKAHAEELGTTAEAIEQMEKPFAHIVLDVTDAEAIRLGQFTAQDLESGGRKVPEVSTVTTKLGDKYSTFANIVLKHEDSDASLSERIDANADEAVKWLNNGGFINNTEGKTLLEDKALCRQFVKDLITDQLFKDSHPDLRTMFYELPKNIQSAIISVVGREVAISNDKSILKDIQESIRAFHELITSSPEFANAQGVNFEKRYAAVTAAVNDWLRQINMDGTVNSEKFSNFALELAKLYKSLKDQKTLAGRLRDYYDLVSGATRELGIFESPANAEPLSKEQAIKQIFGIEYGRQRTVPLAGNNQGSEEGGEGSTGTTEGGESKPEGTGQTNSGRGDTGYGEVSEREQYIAEHPLTEAEIDTANASAAQKILAKAYLNAENEEGLTGMHKAAYTFIYNKKVAAQNKPQQTENKPETPKTEAPKEETPKEEPTGEKPANTANAAQAAAKAKMAAALAKLKKHGKKNDNQTDAYSVDNLTPEQIEDMFEVVEAGAELGYTLLDGIQTKDEWIAQMREAIVEPLKDATGYNDTEVDELLNDMWGYPYTVGEQTKTVGEWAADKGINVNENSNETESNGENPPAELPGSTVVGSSTEGGLEQGGNNEGNAESGGESGNGSVSGGNNSGTQVKGQANGGRQRTGGNGQTGGKTRRTRQSEQPGNLFGEDGGNGTNETGGTGRSGESADKPTGSSGVGRGSVKGQPAAETPKKPVTDISKEKVPYTPASVGGKFAIGSVIPSGIADSIANAFKRLKEKFFPKKGSTLDFVREELGYKTNEEMLSDFDSGKTDGLAAEQVDAVALAIGKMKEGKSFIVGDMTGVGKGRTAAALIRWGKQHGKKVLFITEKSSLFSDMHRDLTDIGCDYMPFVTNSDADANITDGDGNKVIPKPTKAAQSALWQSDKDTLPKDKKGRQYDFVMTTYSQASNPKGADAKNKLEWLKEYAKDAVVIMDESHNASGESNRGEYFKELVKEASGVTFLSATFAKRPDNMLIYAIKSSMSEVHMAVGDMLQAIKDYGVAMQELMASALFGSGEMIRRERDMSDVKTTWTDPKEIYKEEEYEQCRKTSDKTMSLFNQILDFQRDFVNPIVKRHEQDNEAMNVAAALTGAPQRHTTNTSYKSQASNIVGLMVYAMKAKKAAEMAIEQIKQGKKPVIAVENTFGSYVDELDDEVKDANFGPIFEKGVKFSLKYTTAMYEMGDDGKYHKNKDTEITFDAEDELDDDGQRALENLRQAIADYLDDQDKIDLTLSPIDLVKQMIADAGYSCGEITGRSYQLERKEDGGYRKVSFKTKKKDAARKFNGGSKDKPIPENEQYQALVLNVAGATGISLHSSNKFGNQQPRTMIILQPARDVNTEVQMRGRIDRTGQEHRGEYFYVTSPIPAEQKLTMMLKQKLASLDAQSVGTNKVSSNKVESQDMDNKYGDAVCHDFLLEHLQDINAYLENGLRYNNKTREWEGRPGLLYDVLKDIQRMPCDMQEMVINELSQRYADQIDYLNQNGINDLETTTMDLEAVTIDEATFVKGKDNESVNVFAHDTTIERVEVNVLKKPMRSSDIKKKMKDLDALDEDGLPKEGILEQTVKKVKDVVTSRLEERKQKFDEQEAKLEEKIRKDHPKKEEQTDEEYELMIQGWPTLQEMRNKHNADITQYSAELQNQYNDIYRSAMYLKPGRPYLVPLTDDVSYDAAMMYGRFLGFQLKNGDPRQVQAVFAVKDSRAMITIPIVNQKKVIEKILSERGDMEIVTLERDEYGNQKTMEEKAKTWDEWWDKMIPKNTNRQIRYMITGNVLQACGNLGKYKGQIVTFTRKNKETGEITLERGMILAENFDPENFKIRREVEKKDVWDSYDEIKDERSGISCHREGDRMVVKFEKRKGEKLADHPAQKDQALKDLTMNGEIRPSGKTAILCVIKEDNVEKALEHLYKEYGYTKEELFVMPDSTEKPDAIIRTNRPYQEIIDEYAPKYGNNKYTVQNRIRQMLKRYKMDVNNEGLKNDIREAVQLRQAYLRKEYSVKESNRLAWEVLILDQRIEQAKDDKDYREEMMRRKEAILEELEYRGFKGTALHLEQGKMSLDDVRKLFDQMNNTSTEEGKAKKVLFEKVMAKLEKLPMEVYLNEKIDNDTGGFAGGRIINYNWKYMNADYISNDAKASTILHEMIHTVTAYADRCVEDNLEHLLDQDMVDAINELHSIFDAIKNDDTFTHDGVRAYGLTNVREMLSEAGSNSEFRADLKKTGLWARLKAGFLAFFGIKKGVDMPGAKQVNAFEQIMERLEYLIENFKQEAWEEYYKGTRYGGYGYKKADAQRRESERLDDEDLDEGIEVPADEYAKIAQQIATYPKKVERGHVFTDNNYYLCTDIDKDGNFTVLASLPIEGNEEIINEYRRGISGPSFQPVRRGQTTLSIINRIESAGGAVNRYDASSEGYGRRYAEDDSVYMAQRTNGGGNRQAVGENSETPSQKSTFREKIAKHVDKLVNKLGIGEQTTVYHSFEELPEKDKAYVRSKEEKGQQVRGWYENGRVYLYLPHIDSVYQAEKTIWHEVVGHKGMRALLGEEGYRTFMRRLWMDKSEDFEEMHQWVVENYMRYGGNLYETIDEWFAYNVVEPSVPKNLWDKVMLVLSDVLRKLGFMTTPNMKDMKYMLWLSRNAIKEGDAWSELKRNATLAKLDLESRRRAASYSNDGARARDGFANTPTGDTEREMYRSGLMRKMFAWTEAHQDYMASAKLLMDAILKGRSVLDKFNFYWLENHADSKIKIMEDLYVRDYCKPMEEAINRCVAAIGGKLSEAYEVLEDYMAMKHGLERNREFFVRDWMEEKRKKTPTIDDLDEEAKSEYESAVRGIEQGFEDGQIETEEERDKELKKALEDSYSAMLDRIEEGWAAAKAQPTDNLAEWLKGLDDYIRKNIDSEYEAGKHDYSGLTALQPTPAPPEGKPTPAPPEGRGSEGDYDDDAVIGYVMDMESKIGEENVTELWEQKGRMTQFALDIEHEAGLITDKNYDKVSQMFHWYMPLRKWDEDMAEDIWSYMNSKKNTYVGRTLMKAGGRKSRAAMPIGTMFAMGGNAISRAARNEVKKAFAGFVRMYERPAVNDNDPLVTELEAWVENLGTEENPDWVYSFPDIPENATADEVREAKNAWAQHMLELMQEGRAMRVRQGDTIPYRFESKKRSRPEHIVEVYEEGQPHFFIVNDNPRAAQAINGQLKPETKHKITAQINRFMSSVFTSYSPTFMARNAFRDAEFASSMLSVKEGWDYCQKFIKNYMKVTNFVGKRPLMFTLFRKFRDGTLDESDKMERYFKEFAENGGITGYVMENNAERWEKEILAGVKEIGENQVVGITKNIIKRFMEGVEHAGEAIENAARFATYVTSRESGRTVTKSVNDAKEVSVNFNRKGAGHKTESMLNEKGEKTANNVWAAKTAQYMRANTLFYNASLQGIMNTVGNAARKPWWFAAKFAIPPMVLGALVPVFNAWVHAMLDDDDDKVSDDPYADLPEYTRRMNMCLYIGHGKFLMIPISIEHRAFFGLGDIMAGQTYDEKLKNVDKPLAVDAVSQLTAFSPVDYNSREMGIEGVTGWGVGIIVPAYISPLVNAYFNKSWTGSQIQKENAFGGSNLPEYQKAKDYTNKTLVGASRMWHELWGGNDAIRAGREQDSKVMEWIGEVSPAKMEYVVEQYFGEPGKLGTGVSDMFSMMFGDKEADLRKIPVVKAFATLPNENTQFRRANTKYWKYRDEFKKVEQDDRQYRARIEEDPVLKLEYENKFKKSKRYKQWRIYHPGKGGEGFRYKKNIEDLQKRINAEDDPVQKRGMQHERNILVQQLVDTLDNIE